MERLIDFSRSIYELSKEYPEIIEIMKELGFVQISAPGMINTVGRFMTIPKGAASRGIRLEEIKSVLKNKGYSIKE